MRWSVFCSRHHSSAQVLTKWTKAAAPKATVEEAIDAVFMHEIEKDLKDSQGS